MVRRSAHKRIIGKIVVATTSTIFSLFAATTATMAWFAANSTVNAGGMFVKLQAPNGGCEIDHVQLIKFDYHVTNVGGQEQVDYWNPQDGVVARYNYSEEYSSFGKMVNSTWQRVYAMNSYDPVDKYVTQFSFKDRNYNAVYEISFTSSDMAARFMQLYAERDVKKAKHNHEIYLTDCVDFDVFSYADLDDDNPLFVNPEDANDNKNYYPSYIADRNTVLSTDAEIFYKVSYLASLKNSHPHFYDTNPKPTSIMVGENVPVDFSIQALTTFYINVNYAPTKADVYVKDILLSNILAIYDYSFNFLFTETEIS